MFKSMSEILFAPQNAKRDGGELPSADVADPAFAEVLKDAEDAGTADATDAPLFAAAMLAVLPQPVTPMCIPGGGEVATVRNDDEVLLADDPTIDVTTSTPTTGNAPESSSQLLEMIFGVASTAMSFDIAPSSPVMPQIALGDVTTAITPEVGPFDQTKITPLPPTTITDAPEIALDLRAVRPTPEPWPQTPPSNEMVPTPEDATDPAVNDAPAPLDPHAAQVEPRSTGPNPPLMVAVESTAAVRTIHEIPNKDVAFQITTDLAAAPEIASLNASTPRRDEGKTQFLWRQAMQAEVAPVAASNIQPPAAPTQGRDDRDAETGLNAPREDGPITAPADTAPALPSAEAKPDGASTFSQAETPKPDAAAVPGAALGLTQLDRALPGPIQHGEARHHGPATPVRQVIETIAAQPLDVPGRIELTLTPETLGKVHFDMRPEGGSLSIVLSAERADTLDLMRRHLPDLMAELKQAGIQAGSFSFSSWNEGQRAPPPQPEMNMGELSSAIAAAPVAPPRPARNPGPLGGLDMRF